MKMNEFKEDMKYKHKLVFIFLAAMMGFFVYAIVQQVMLGRPFGDIPVSNEGLFLMSGMMGLVLLLFLNMRLKLVVNVEGIHFKYFPFHFSERSILWDDIEEANVITEGVLLKMGGHGVRKGWNKSAYSIGSDAALEVVLHTGKRVYISTRRPDVLRSILNNLNKGSKSDFKKLL